MIGLLYVHGTVRIAEPFRYDSARGIYEGKVEWVSSRYMGGIARKFLDKQELRAIMFYRVCKLSPATNVKGQVLVVNNGFLEADDQGIYLHIRSMEVIGNEDETIPDPEQE